MKKFSDTFVSFPSLVCGALALVFAGGAGAASIPGIDRELSLNAREQPVDKFVEAFFRELGVPVDMHADVKGSVNGRFDGTAASVLEEIGEAFDLIVYFDGAVAHVYRDNEITRTLLPLERPAARRVARLAEELDLPDPRNKIVVLEDGGVLVTGTARFAEQIQEVILSIGDMAESRPAPTPAPTPPPAPMLSAEEIAARAAMTAVGGGASMMDLMPDGPGGDAIVYRVFHLKHAWADDKQFNAGGESMTVPGVATTLRALISDIPVAPGGGRTVMPSNGPRALRGLADRPIVGDVPDTVVAPLRAGDESLARIVADPRMNAVIVRDRKDRMEGYEALVAGLDMPSEMIEIEATIIDVLTDRVRELGVNWRARGDNAEVLLGSGDAGDAALVPSASGAPPVAGGRGGVLSFALGEQFDFLSRVRLLEERGAANVVSKPHVTTLTDLEAVLSATTEFFVRVAGEQDVNLFSVPVGTTLRVTPHVFKQDGGNRIKLLVRIEDGSRSGADQVDSIPVIERASLSTQAIINEGDSLLIGGLVRDSSTRSDNRIPVLGSIPILGSLFRSSRNTVTRVERLFMITPRVSSGLGFDQTGDLPRLEGRLDDITVDAGRRLDGAAWPESPMKEFGDRGFGPLAPNPDRRSTAPLTRMRPDDVVEGRGDDQYGSDPYSGFAVERWSGESQPRTVSIVPATLDRPAVDPISGFTVEPWSVQDAPDGR